MGVWIGELGRMDGQIGRWMIDRWMGRWMEQFPLCFVVNAS